MVTSWSNGVVLGKFMPLHLGHEYLINTALEHCDFLTIVVCTLQREPIDGDLRYRWMVNRYQETIAARKAQVCHLDEDWIPQVPEDCHSPQVFYGTWAGVLTALAGRKLDVIFTSETYGDQVAAYLKCDHFLVDIERRTIPVSGSMIRSNPLSYVHQMNEEVASYFYGQKNTHRRT